MPRRGSANCRTEIIRLHDYGFSVAALLPTSQLDENSTARYTEPSLASFDQALPRRRPHSSEVAQPPIAPARLDPGEPPADGIERDHHNEPDQIDNGKAVAEVRRKQLGRPGHGGWRVEDEAGGRRSVAEIGHPNQKQMDQEEMKDEVKHRNASEDYEGIGGREGAPHKPGEQKGSRPQRHQQEIERGRILRAVQEGENREDGRFLRRPWRRISILIEGADH